MNQESLEIKDLEIFIKESLPNYQITGTLEFKKELSIRHKGAACHVKIYAERFLIYSFGGNIRNIRMVLPIIIFFLTLPIFFACVFWYLLDLYFQKEAKKIGTELEQLFIENDIDLERYDPPKW